MKRLSVLGNRIHTKKVETLLSLLWAAVMLALLYPLPCAGQQVNATLSGTIRDSSGAVVPQAAVTVENMDTTVTRKTTSDSQGHYIFPSLPPATYSLSAEKSGFNRTVIPNIALSVYQNSTIDMVLRVGQVKQAVEVKGAAPLVSTTSASIGTLVGQRETEDLPLNARRTSALALLVPAMANTSGHSLTSASGNGSGFNQTSFSSAGGTSASNLILIDGMLNRALNNGGFAVDLAPEMVKEFKIQNNVYDATYGFTAGAVMNIVTPSGTNKFHGSAWDYLRNRVLDARNFFALNQVDPSTGAEIPGSARPAFIRNQFGFAAGGPIIKNKTFIFGSYEGLRRVQGVTSKSTVPTLDQRSGNFSSYLTGQTINLCGAGGPSNLNFDSGQLFDPGTEYQFTCPTGSALAGSTILAGTPVAGNMITSINPIAQEILALYPKPNAPGAVNFINSTPEREQDDTFLVRVDENISAKDQLFVHYILGNSNILFPGNFDPFNTYQHYRGQNAVLGWTHIFSPTLLSEAHVGIFRGYQNREPSDAPHPPGTLAGFGIQGVSAPTPQQELLPDIVLDNYAEWGDGGYNPDILPDMLEKYEGTVTKIRGRQTLKFGGNFNFYQILGYQDPMQLNSQVSFNGQYSSLAGLIPGVSGISDLADMELGYPSSGLYMKNAFINEYVGGGWFGLFAQDNIRVNDRLNLQLGLRWEYRKQPHDRHNKIASIFPLSNSFTPGDALLVTALPNAANGALCNQPYFISTTTGQCLVMTSAQRSQYGFTGGKVQQVSLGDNGRSFAPRVGISWRPTHSDKLVIHTGAGIFYDMPETNQLVAYNNNNPVDSQTLEYTPALGAPPPLINGAPTTTETLFVGAGQITLADVSGQLSALPMYFTPTVYEWSFMADSQLARNWALEVGYIGNRGIHLSSYYSPGNQAQPGVGAIGPRRVWPDFGAYTYNDYFGISRYNALTARLQKRFSQGFSLLTSYTFSKEMDYNGGDTSEGNRPQDANNPMGSYSVGNINIPQVLTISPIWELPFGNGQHFLNTKGLVNALAGGWEFAGILSFRSGFPITIRSPQDFSNSGSSDPFPDRVCNGAGPQTVSEWFNTSCFTTNQLALALANGTPRFGNAGRNILVGPGLNEWDASFIKRNQISERFSLQFRAEFFNLFNRPNFDNPGNRVGSGSFGKISGAGSPRDIQFGLKLTF